MEFSELTLVTLHLVDNLHLQLDRIETLKKEKSRNKYQLTGSSTRNFEPLF
jgi:hypothetical protein